MYYQDDELSEICKIPAVCVRMTTPPKIYASHICSMAEKHNEEAISLLASGFLCIVLNKFHDFAATSTRFNLVTNYFESTLSI